MHSNRSSFSRRNQVKKTSWLLMLALVLYAAAVSNGYLTGTWKWVFTAVLGLLMLSWIILLGTGKVWEEWFWKKRL